MAVVTRNSRSNFGRKSALAGAPLGFRIMFAVVALFIASVFAFIIYTFATGGAQGCYVTIQGNGTYGQVYSDDCSVSINN